MPRPSPADIARAALELRQREERRRLADRYDWYGDECPCGLPLGECREHPRARPAQRPPGSHRASNPVADWRVWMLKGGRGFGKSIAASKYVNAEVEAGRANWVALIGATAKDVRDFQIEHPYSGLVAAAPPWFKPVYEPSKARVTWPNGSYATIYTAEEPEALRGGGFNLAWADELAKWQRNQQYTWDMLLFCLREITEPRPRVVISTTPRPTATYKAIRDDPRTACTGGPMAENRANLDADYLADMERRYRGTRMGRQELDAEDLEDTPGALWTNDMIADAFAPSVPEGVSLVEVVVADDPGAGSNDPELAAETGIVVGGRGSDGLCYILADLTLKGTPGEWGRATVNAYGDYRASWVVAEANNGGDMVEHVVQTAAEKMGQPRVRYEKLWASRGKVTRAEPVAALYEQRRVRHVGRFEKLEKQLTEWVPGDKSPDRLDALVWCVTKLMVGSLAAPTRCVSGGPPSSPSGSPFAGSGLPFGGTGMPGIF